MGKGVSTWKWNTNHYHFRNWTEYAKGNWLFTGLNVLFFVANAVETVLFARQPSWWALYFGFFTGWFIYLGYVVPRRRIRQDQKTDRDFVSSMTDHGMPVIVAQEILARIQADRVDQAAALALEWLDRRPE